MGMRVTQNMLNQSMLRNVNTSYQNLSKLQNEVSSGKKINLPSDDPFGAGEAMGYTTKLSEIQTFQGNASDAKNTLNATDDAISSANNLFNTLKGLVVQASSDTLNASDRQAMAEQVKTIKDEFGDMANTQYNGKYIFAKPGTTTPPYQNGSLDQSQLSDTPQNVELAPGSTIQKNILGNDLFLSNSTSSTSIFDELDQLASDLSDNTKSGVDISSAHLQAVDDQFTHFTTIQTTVGARADRVNQAIDRLGTSEVNVNQYLSDTEDVDVAKAMTDLSSQETVQKAALSVGARIIQTTLMDYLK
jgi:flagellar hook-associated protein 3 FlgL